MTPLPDLSSSAANRGLYQSMRDVMTSLEGVSRMAVALITRPLRRRRTIWGATPAEIAAVYPGDNAVPQPNWEYTHAIDVDAPRERVWPWLIQIGQGRGGFYSYQGLENLVGCQIRNATKVHPEFGSLEVGDEVKLHPKAPGLHVVVADPNRSLVLSGSAKGSPDRSLWAFHLVDVANGRTRLIERGRYAYGRGLVSRLSFSPTFLEPISFVMSRKMLLTIADLARAGEGQ